MFISNIMRRIEISIEAVATVAAKEEALRTAIIAGLMPTTRTGLAGVPGVYFDHRDATGLCFVREEAMELGKRPAMEAVLIVHVLVLIASPNLGRFADIGQVLEDKGAARGGILYKAFGEDMIVIFSLPKPLTRKLFQVPFGRFAPLLLKCATEAEHAALLLFPAAIPQESTLGGHCRVV
jgi:hypothetical protein